MEELQQQLLNNLYDYMNKMNRILESFNVSVQALNEAFNARQRQAYEQAAPKPEPEAEVKADTEAADEA